MSGLKLVYLSLNVLDRYVFGKCDMCRMMSIVILRSCLHSSHDARDSRFVTSCRQSIHQFTQEWFALVKAHLSEHLSNVLTLNDTELRRVITLGCQWWSIGYVKETVKSQTERVRLTIMYVNPN